MICLEKVKDFDYTRGDLEHFLRVTVHNRLVNRFKDLTKSVRSPCPRCPFYDKGAPSDCSKFGDNRNECGKWRNFELSTQSRNSLLNASEQQVERHAKESIVNKASAHEIQKLLKERIPEELIYDLEKLISGAKISKQRLKKLRMAIMMVLDSPQGKKFLKLQSISDFEEFTQITINGVKNGEKA